MVVELSYVFFDYLVYIQYFYDYVLVNQCGIDVFGFNDIFFFDLVGICVECDVKGSVMGKLFGDIVVFNQFFVSISCNVDCEGGLW